MSLVIEREPTFKTAALAGLNLFLGAGFSIYASSSKGNLPLGDELKNELCEIFECPNLAILPLPRIYDVLFRQRPNELTSYLKSRFTVEHFDDRYLNISNVSINSIITTNIDNLVYKIFAADPPRYLNDIIVGGSAFKAPDAVDYVPLHGSVMHEETNYTFGSLDLATAFARDPDRFHFLTERIQSFPTLFWGYSLQDAGGLQAIDRRTVAGRDHQPKWIQLHAPNEADRLYFSALGFSVIEGTTDELLEYFADLPPVVQSIQTSGPLLHRYERVPQIAEVKSRSISEFWLGFPPVWHDILTNRLPRLSYFSKCEDIINAGRHIVVAGIPQSGKSTLIMQLAAFANAPGARVILEAGDPGKAQSLVARLGGSRAIIFIDEAANSADVLNVLACSPRITVVAADRHFNIEIASHRFDRSNFDVLDISDLTEVDTRAIFNAIPHNMKKPQLVIPKMAGGRNPSLYEIISYNTRGTQLAARFAHGIKDMESRGIETHDLFLMICYVHMCRTPVSFDMAWAFLRAGNHTEVYAELQRLGALLSEYVGDSQMLIDDDQDYFSPRSVHIAEEVLKASSRDAFRRMFLRFHKNVSSYRIAQYDIFKRFGYDANHARRAFVDAKEGISFYDDAFSRDGSYYLLQQKAIFLSRQKMFKEAFATIDDALLLSGGRIPTIRHTHAEILFDANINLAHSDTSARAELRKSLMILEECRRYDKRKAYHAFKFAEEACKYYDAYSDEESARHLTQAKSWLEEELGNPFAKRRAKEYLRDVEERVVSAGR